MRLRALDIHLEGAKVGQLFQYGEGRAAITRLVPEESFWRNPRAPLLSWATVTAPEDRAAFWTGFARVPFFNGDGPTLPPFFQNMLPEGALRRHLAQVRGCALDDHFELLAACGTDLPGAVYAQPAHLGRRDVEAIVTQHHDALEMTVVAEPLADATSLSGLQAKLSLVQQGGRYVARTRDARGLHIIAKLPTVEAALLPEVEDLSLRLAAAAGVRTCTARLAALDEIDVEVPFVLGQARTFLAVERFDRQDGKRHVHCEDFAQILGIPPEQKYSFPHATYGLMARVLQSMGLGDEGMHEFIRRLTVNELLGNYDAHVKNFGVLYPDGRTPQLSPAYDIVAHAIYVGGSGHALPFARNGTRQARLGPMTLREFCNEAGYPETIASGVVRETVKAAVDSWPSLVESSVLLEEQKQRLLAHFEAVPIVQSFRRRRGGRKAAAGAA
jgi:serine/threonine-protein kinase HipA